MPRPCHPKNVIVKLFQIDLDNIGRISSRIATDEHWPHDIAVLFLDLIDHASHFVQLFRADVGAVRETKVHQAVLALQILLREFLAIVVHKMERSSDKRPADAFVLFYDALASDACLLISKIECQANAGREEEYACLP